MNLRKYLSTMKDYDTDDMLGVMGLQKRSSGDWVFPMMAGIGAGMAIGAGLALFLTPYKGEEAREKFRKGATEAQKLLNTQVGQLSEKVAMLTEKMGITGATEGEGKQIGTGAVAASRPASIGTPATGGTGGTVGNGNRGY